MESFEELELSAELVEALALEGLERPTSLQANAIPVLRRGGSVVLRAGPGGGSFPAYAAALLDGIEPGANHPRALVISLTRERASALAVALAGIAQWTGHRIGALGVPWAFPERADILFTTLEDLLGAVRSASVKIDLVSSVVLDGASVLLEKGEGVEGILQGVDRDGLQLVLVTDEVTPTVRAFVEQHARRAVFLPTEAGAAEEEETPVQRGALRVRAVPGDKEDVLPGLLLSLLEGGSSHVLLFAHTDDRVADLGSYLTHFGLATGAPGSAEVPVWLGVDPLEGRAAMRERGAEGISVVSVDLPLDADELDRRHGGANGGNIVIAHPRELPHLRHTARAAGYTVEVIEEESGKNLDEVESFLAGIEKVIAEADLLPFHILLEPLLKRAGAVEVAAALAFLLRQKGRPAGAGAAAGEDRSAAVSRPPAWARLFLSVGERDGVTARDLLGAIIGESGIAGDQVGRIDLRETFSRVEVQEPVADRVIRALNGTSIRGRSVRADFDRGEPARSPRGAAGGPRREDRPRERRSDGRPEGRPDAKRAGKPGGSAGRGGLGSRGGSGSRDGAPGGKRGGAPEGRRPAKPYRKPDRPE